MKFWPIYSFEFLKLVQRFKSYAYLCAVSPIYENSSENFVSFKVKQERQTAHGGAYCIKLERNWQNSKGEKELGTNVENLRWQLGTIERTLEVW